MKKCLVVLLLLPVFANAQIDLPLALQTPPLGTSHGEMMTFLTKIVAKSVLLELEIAGKSSVGRDIPVVYFPKRNHWRSHRATIMLFAQQHGNEPSGKEALLMLIHELNAKRGQARYRNLNLILVPMANPDGNELYQRRNGNQVDLNRNHLLLSEPETQLLHQLFERYRPEVTLDIHEYGPTGWLALGLLKDLGEQLDCISNPAIPVPLKRFAVTEILEPALDSTMLKGVKAGRYLITGADPTQPARHSTTDIDDGRNSFGIHYTLSFILEGMAGFSKSDRIWERAKSQLTMIKAFLNICDAKAGAITSIVRHWRKQSLHQVPDTVIIQANYTEKYSRPLTVNVTRCCDRRDTTIILSDYRPNPEPIVFVLRPKAYLIEQPDSTVLSVLKHHLLPYRVLVADTLCRVEQFEVTGIDTLRFEGRETLIPAGSYTRKEKNFSRGCILVPTNHGRAILLVQMLEPQSFYGLSHYAEFQFLSQNKFYPIYRLIE
ncbi:MAG: DUF2817 domain-containing protein [candidate division KSB1 bacterium]|nr:DUF2817 domain-containing protein [candidate division KSB1 bacterium]MDZ7334345.1 DUF2817 domain-containing protein [candidate division KSB1 bacterium]MDZ7356386.1 DUF2817 domain-containing protein [candidate division KSB1 bacterium]MDZ7399306.1 DUF2817 domain-containing protein [candidate division KSB1 bacterium]